MVEKKTNGDAQEVAEKENQTEEESVLEQVNDAEERVKSCGQECEQTQDQLRRVAADFSNYRTRMQKERIQSLQLGQVAVLSKLLTIVDDVDRAIEEAKKQKMSDTSWLRGFELIAKSVHQLLVDHNVHVIKQMETFDPKLHEALSSLEDTGKKPGTIIDVLQKGFMIDDRVLRPAKVTVAK